MASSNTKRNKEARHDDLYSTPKEAVDFLIGTYGEMLKHNRFGVLEPCCGLGAISEPMSEYGVDVDSIDLYDHGYGIPHTDFLNWQPQKKYSWVVMNPPFKLTEEFVDKALEVCEEGVLMFNRLTTLESIGRATKFSNGTWPLSHVHIFGYRVSCPEGPEMKPSPNSVAYAWYVFDKQKHPMAEPTISWILK